MSDSSLGSAGAKIVARSLHLCKNLSEINLRKCEIKDAGAKALFDELHKT